MKKRVITLSLFTVIFAGFFGIFHVYMSQADALKTSNNTITVPLDSYEGKEYFSSFSQEAFTGALQIARIRSMMSAPYDPNAHVKFLYRVEYPEFLSTINTPITNFLSAQIQQAEEDLKVYNAQDQENFPELTGHFDAYSGSGFHTLVFSLSYHVDALFPYQKLQSFLIDDHGMYVSPHDLVALSSENKSAFFTKIRPYLEQQ